MRWKDGAVICSGKIRRKDRLERCGGGCAGKMLRKDVVETCSGKMQRKDAAEGLAEKVILERRTNRKRELVRMNSSSDTKSHKKQREWVHTTLRGVPRALPSYSLAVCLIVCRNVHLSMQIVNKYP